MKTSENKLVFCCLVIVIILFCCSVSYSGSGKLYEDLSVNCDGSKKISKSFRHNPTGNIYAELNPCKDSSGNDKYEMLLEHMTVVGWAEVETASCYDVFGYYVAQIYRVNQAGDSQNDYRIVVEDISDNCQSGDTFDVRLSYMPAPAKPTGLTASYDYSWWNMNIDWNDVVQDSDDSLSEDIKGYLLYRGNVDLFGGDPSEYTDYQDDFDFTNSVTYKVKALDYAHNESLFSDSVTVVPDTTPPPVPEITLEWVGNGYIEIKTSIPHDQSGQITEDLSRILIYKSENTQGSTCPTDYEEITYGLVTPSSGYCDTSKLYCTFADYGVTGGNAYYYRVTSADVADNESNCSDSINAVAAVMPPYSLAYPYRVDDINDNTKLAGTYNEFRGWNRGAHSGTDFSIHNTTNDEIYAIAPGKVVFVQKTNVSGYGYQVIIKHRGSDGNDLYSHYAHLENAPTLSVGNIIDGRYLSTYDDTNKPIAREKIGDDGNSGLSAGHGEHLHLNMSESINSDNTSIQSFAINPLVHGIHYNDTENPYFWDGSSSGNTGDVILIKNISTNEYVNAERGNIIWGNVRLIAGGYDKVPHRPTGKNGFYKVEFKSEKKGDLSVLFSANHEFVDDWLANRTEQEVVYFNADNNNTTTSRFVLYKDWNTSSSSNYPDGKYEFTVDFYDVRNGEPHSSTWPPPSGSTEFIRTLDNSVPILREIEVNDSGGPIYEANWEWNEAIHQRELVEDYLGVTVPGETLTFSLYFNESMYADGDTTKSPSIDVTEGTSPFSTSFNGYWTRTNYSNDTWVGTVTLSTDVTQGQKDLQISVTDLANNLLDAHPQDVAYRQSNGNWARYQSTDSTDNTGNVGGADTFHKFFVRVDSDPCSEVTAPVCDPNNAERMAMRSASSQVGCVDYCEIIDDIDVDSYPPDTDDTYPNAGTFEFSEIFSYYMDVSPLDSVNPYANGVLEPGDRVYFQPALQVTLGNVPLDSVKGVLSSASTECIDFGDLTGESIGFSLPTGSEGSTDYSFSSEFYEFNINTECTQTNVNFDLNITAYSGSVTYAFNVGFTLNIEIKPVIVGEINACDGEIEGITNCTDIPPAPYGYFDNNGKWHFSIRRNAVVTGSMPFKTIMPSTESFSNPTTMDINLTRNVHNMFGFIMKEFSPDIDPYTEGVTPDFEPISCTVFYDAGGLVTKRECYNGDVMKFANKHNRNLLPGYCIIYTDEPHWPQWPQRCYSDSGASVLTVPADLNAGQGIDFVGAKIYDTTVDLELNHTYLNLSGDNSETQRLVRIFPGINSIGTPFNNWNVRNNFQVRDIYISCNGVDVGIDKAVSEKKWLQDVDIKGNISPLFVKLYGDLSGGTLDPQTNYSVVGVNYNHQMIPFVQYTIHLTEDETILPTDSNCYMVFDKNNVGSQSSGRVAHRIAVSGSNEEDEYQALINIAATSMQTGSPTGDYVNRFGISSLATDEIDNLYDVKDSINYDRVISDTVKEVQEKKAVIYFIYDEKDQNTGTIIKRHKLSSDIRGLFQPDEEKKTWKFYVEQKNISGTVLLKWKADKLFSDNYGITLFDDEDEIKTDMTKFDRYSYTSSLSTRQFSIIVEKAKPSPPIITSVAGRNGAVEIEWIPPKQYTNGKVLTELGGFDIYRLNPGDYELTKINTMPIDPKIFSYQDTGLINGTPYAYAIVACDSAQHPNCSEFSERVPALPQSSTTSFVLEPGWNLVGISRLLGIYELDIYENAKTVFDNRETYRIESDGGHSKYAGWVPSTGFGPWFDYQCRLDNAKPGTAYWVYNPPENGQSIIPVYGMESAYHPPPDISTAIFRIQLDKGWNMVASPFNVPITWDGENIYFNGMPLNEEINAGNVSWPYKYETSTGQYIQIDPQSYSWQPWEGYALKSNIDGAFLEFDACSPNCSREIDITFDRICQEPKEPVGVPPAERPLGRMISTSDGKNEIKGASGTVFVIDLQIEAEGFTDASFIVEYDDTVIKPCVSDAGAPGGCRVLTEGESVPVSPANGLQAWTATVGSSIRFDLVSFGAQFIGIVDLGTIKFIAQSGAEEKTTDITFNTDEDKLLVMGKINGSVTSDYNIEVSPARFVGYQYIDSAPPSITITNITPTPPETYIVPGSASAPSSVSVSYRFTDNYYDTGDINVSVYNPAGTTVLSVLETASGVPVGVERTISWNGMVGGSAALDGEYPIKVKATDPRGNTKTETVYVTVDKTGPVITYPMPASGQDTGTITPEIRVRIEDSGVGVDPDGLVMEVDGAPVAAIWNSGTKLLTAPSSLVLNPVNEHTVIVTAQDKLGNETEYEWSFTVDGTAPNEPTVTFYTEQILSPLESAMGISVPRDGKQYVSGNAMVVSSAKDNDNGIGITRLELFVDNELIGTQTYPSPVTNATALLYWNTLEEITAGTPRYPDGEYELGVVAVDLTGNRSATTSVSVIVDNTKPAYGPTTVSDDGYFSVDGNSNVKSVDVDFSLIETSPFGWRLEIGTGDKVAGPWNEVYSETQSVSGPDFTGSVTWNGSYNMGGTVPDGEYRYYLIALDAAANATPIYEAESGTIVVDSISPEITMMSPVDKDVLSDNVVFEIEASDDRSGIEKVELIILPVDGGNPTTIVVAESATPGIYIYEWETTEDDDGIYEVEVTSYDITGNYLTLSAIEISIANKAASIANVQDAPDPFSPSPPGNSLKTSNTIEFSLLTSVQTVGLDWGIEIGPESNGSVFKTFTGSIPSGGTKRRHDIGPLVWDGKNDSGSAVADDGQYIYMIYATTTTGASAWATGGTILVDHTIPEITAAALPDFFNPDGNGQTDDTKISADIVEANNFTATMGLYCDLSNTECLAAYGTGTLLVREGQFAGGTGSIEYGWDGKTGDPENSEIVPDGDYVFRIGIEDAAGNMAEADGVVTKDNPPVITLYEATVAFSPDDDGVKEEAILEWTANEEGLFTLKVYDKEWNHIDTFATDTPNAGQVGATMTVSWDGLQADGVTNYPEDTYWIEITGRDSDSRELNPCVPRTAKTLLDVTDPIVTATATPDFFNPDGNGQTDKTKIIATVAEKNPFTARVEVTGSGYSYEYESYYIPDKTETTGIEVEWNGMAKGPDGVTSLVPDGDYTYKVYADDIAGNKSNIVEGIITKDNPPVITLHEATPAFSPDGDGSIDRDIVTWSADQEGFFTFKVYDTGGALIDTIVEDLSNTGYMGTATGTAWNGLQMDGTNFPEDSYRIEVTGRDANSRKENPCVPKQAGTILDVTDPVVAAFYPYEDEFTPLMPKFKVNVTDNLSGFSVEPAWAEANTRFYIDSDASEIPASVNMSGPLAYRAWGYPGGDLAEGPHNLKATAMDLAGNAGKLDWMRFVAIPALEDDFGGAEISTDKWLEMLMGDHSGRTTGTAALQSGGLVIDSSTTIPDNESDPGIDTYGYGITGKRVFDITRPEVILEASDVTLNGSGSMYLGGLLMSYLPLGGSGDATVGGMALLVAHMDWAPSGTYAMILLGVGSNTTIAWWEPVSTPVDLKIHYEEGQAKFYVDGQLKRSLPIQLSHVITGAYAGSGFDEDDYDDAHVHMQMSGLDSNLAAPVVKDVTITNAERPDSPIIHPGEEHYELRVEGTPWQKHLEGRIVNFDGIREFGMTSVDRATIGETTILEETFEGSGEYKTLSPILLDTVLDKTGRPTKRPVPFASIDTYSALPFPTVNFNLGAPLYALTEAVDAVTLENTDYPPGYAHILPGEHFRVVAETRPGTWEIDAYILSWDALNAGSSYGEAVIAGPLKMVKASDERYEVSGTLDDIDWNGASSTRVLAWTKYGVVKDEEKLSANMLEIGQPAILYATVNNNDRYGAEDVNLWETVEVTAKALPGQPYLIGMLVNADNLDAPDMKYRVGNPFAMEESPVGSGEYKGLIVLKTDFDNSGETVARLKALTMTSDYSAFSISWNELALPEQDKVAPASPEDTVIISGVQNIPAQGAPIETSLTWTKPSANEDGTQLTDLAGYNVYRVYTEHGEGSMTVVGGSDPLRIEQITPSIYDLDNTTLRYKNADFNTSPFPGGAAGWLEKDSLVLTQLPLQNSTLIEPGKDIYAYTVAVVFMGILYPNGGYLMTIYSQEPVEEVDRWLRSLKTMEIAREDSALFGYTKAFTAMPDGSFMSAEPLEAVDFDKLVKINDDPVAANKFIDGYNFDGALYRYSVTAVDEYGNESAPSIVASVPPTSVPVLSATLSNIQTSVRQGYIGIGDEFVLEVTSDIPQPLTLDVYLLNKGALDKRMPLAGALIDGPIRLQPAGGNIYRVTRTLNTLSDAGGWMVSEIVAVVGIVGENENVTAAGVLKRNVLEGEITPDKEEYISGETISAYYSTQNMSEAALENVQLILRLRDEATGNVLSETAGPTIAELGSWEAATGTLQIPIPSGLTEEKDYQLVLVAEIGGDEDVAAETTVHVIPERVIITDARPWPDNIVPYQEPFMNYTVINQTLSPVTEGIVSGKIVSPGDPDGYVFATFTDKVTKYGTTIAPGKFLKMTSTFTPVYARENGTYQIMIYYQDDAASEPELKVTTEITVEGCQ